MLKQISNVRDRQMWGISVSGIIKSRVKSLRWLRSPTVEISRVKSVTLYVLWDANTRPINNSYQSSAWVLILKELPPQGNCQHIWYLTKDTTMWLPLIVIFRGLDTRCPCCVPTTGWLTKWLSTNGCHNMVDQKMAANGSLNFYFVPGSKFHVPSPSPSACPSITHVCIENPMDISVV